MNHTEFFAALKQETVGGCYLFEGEEEYTKRSALKALREKVAGGDFAAMNDTRRGNAALPERAPLHRGTGQRHAEHRQGQGL